MSLSMLCLRQQQLRPRKSRFFHPRVWFWAGLRENISMSLFRLNNSAGLRDQLYLTVISSQAAKRRCRRRLAPMPSKTKTHAPGQLSMDCGCRGGKHLVAHTAFTNCLNGPTAPRKGPTTLVFQSLTAVFASASVRPKHFTIGPTSEHRFIFISSTEYRVPSTEYRGVQRTEDLVVPSTEYRGGTVA